MAGGIFWAAWSFEPFFAGFAPPPPAGIALGPPGLPNLPPALPPMHISVHSKRHLALIDVESRQANAARNTCNHLHGALLWLLGGFGPCIGRSGGLRLVLILPPCHQYVPIHREGREGNCQIPGIVAPPLPVLSGVCLALVVTAAATKATSFTSAGGGKPHIRQRSRQAQWPAWPLVAKRHVQAGVHGPGSTSSGGWERRLPFPLPMGDELGWSFELSFVSFSPPPLAGIALGPPGLPSLPPVLPPLPIWTGKPEPGSEPDSLSEKH